nr:CGNR zinc finger domain-containing protein [Auraticoccus cholistanensis]
MRDFVNTYEPQLDEESLTTSAALRDWLVEQRLVPVEARVTDDDLDAARAVREGLREVLLGHAGHDTDPDSLGRLRTVLADFPVRVHLDADGYRLVGARSDAVGRAVGELLDAVRRATEDGTWPRLKVCARDSCRWAFYDASRNQVRRWCSMAGCGNAVKMRRAYAARRARTRQEP